MTQCTRIVRLKGVELEVRLCGPPDGQAVILLHGFPQAAIMWDCLAGALADAGYRTIALNQRGYGRSSRPRGIAAYDLDRLAADVRELAQALGHNAFTVVGHDWGAVVGWWLASAHDGRLKGLIAISAAHPAVWRETMVGDKDQKRRSRYVRLFRIPVIPEILILLTGYAGLKRAVADAGASKAAREVYLQSWRAPGSVTAMLNWYRALLRKSFAPPASVGVPTLFIYGREDPFLSEAAVRRTKMISPDVEAVQLGEGHWLVDRSATKIRRLVLDFLDGRHRA